MMRRKIFLLLQLGCLLFVLLSLIAGFRHYGFGSSSDHMHRRIKGLGHKEPEKSHPGSSSQAESSSELREGNSTLLEMVPPYIRAIMTPEDKSFPRVDCPKPRGDRYNYLQNNDDDPVAGTAGRRGRRRRYFFALDLHQCVGLLPRLLGSIVESIRFLGPENCALSVVEGRSDDGTFETLKSLRPELESLGVKYFFNSNDIDPTAKGGGGDRIQRLAELRNQALQPLVENPGQYTAEPTVVFLNDVAICMEDILELIHQRRYQSADMTCALDWTYVGPDPTFYDVWIARGMNGDSFFNIPEDGNWNSAWNLFWNNPEAQSRLRVGLPFQVFSCWNGATAFTARPFLEKKVRFRDHYDTECFQGEPKLFCKDLWYFGHGKIAVVPSVNLAYNDEDAKKIKATKGYVSRWTDGHDQPDMPVKLEWTSAPPPTVKCMPSYSNQTWLPWDEGLKAKGIVPRG